MFFLLRQIGYTTGMVHVGVGNEYFFKRHAIGGNGLLNAFEVATRIDNGAASGLLTPHQGAILLKGRDGNDGELHEFFRVKAKVN
jgi:hypothetical protein